MSRQYPRSGDHWNAAAHAWRTPLLALIASCGRPPVATRLAPTPLPSSAAVSDAPQPATPALPLIRVDVSPRKVAGEFRPNEALGTSVDRVPTGSVDTLYSPAVLDRILSAGWGAVSYRLNTELHVEAWHWNPRGSWSDPAGRGYFSGSAELGEPIRHSFGYPLPRRGFTRNEGTENEGYSRLTDGDPKSFWKSNPYLSHAFIGESDDTSPQWVVVDLGERRDVDAIRMAWAAPYAKRYAVQYWTGEEAIKKPAAGQWNDFPSGRVAAGRGGIATLKLAPSPVAVRFVRIRMDESSETCDPRTAADPRSCEGFAMYELGLGTLSGKGEFHDLVRHEPTQSQTATYCSSVDPWHERADLDRDRGEQVGLDLFYTSGITRGLPAMIPVAMFYGTPEDSAAEIAYVESRKFPISYVELGEEPDGQYMTPEHYAALYVQWATAIHRVDPALKLGGPVFASANEDIKAWPDARGETSWLRRFVAYLKAHGRVDDLAFMSFEHYPYDPCKITWDSLYEEPALITHIMQAWRDDGLPPRLPLLATEVNLAWQASEPFVDLLGGLWLADYTGAFLTAGGRASSYFQYFPSELSRQCDPTYGGFTMFAANGDRSARQPLSQYFAAQLVTQEWVLPGSGVHRIFPVSSDVVDAAGRTVVTGYAVQRPDGQWAVLLVNKDPLEPRTLRVVFRDGDTHHESAFAGDVTIVTFGADNYVWHANGAAGRADPDGPLARTTRPAGDGAFVLPKASASVLRGVVTALNVAAVPR